MVRIDTKTQAGATKNRVELEPGDEGRRASSAPLGLVPSTYDASTSLRRPRKTLTRFVSKSSFLMHDVMKCAFFDDV